MDDFLGWVLVFLKDFGAVFLNSLPGVLGFFRGLAVDFAGGLGKAEFSDPLMVLFFAGGVLVAVELLKAFLSQVRNLTLLVLFLLAAAACAALFIR